MNVYGTPEQQAAYERQREDVSAALDEAVHNGAFLLTAMDLNEDPAVVERWIDTVWNNLRDRLDEEDRLVAVVMLLEPQIEQAAQRLKQVNA